MQMKRQLMDRRTPEQMEADALESEQKGFPVFAQLLREEAAFARDRIRRRQRKAEVEE